MAGVGRRGAALVGLGAAAVLGIRSAGAQGVNESTFDRVSRTKVMRVAALPGELPYFSKDLVSGEWKGSAILFAQDLAKSFDAKLEFVESTYGGSILDLQSNKIDIGFALNPTPQRAMVVAFTRPVFNNPFGCLAKKGLAPKTWADLNKPEIRIVCDLGSTHEVVARRFAPLAQIKAMKNRDDATAEFQSGRADVLILAAILGLSAVGKNRSLGPYYLPSGPMVALPSNIAMRREPDTRFLDVVNAWVDYNRGTGQIRDWLLAGLALSGVQPDDMPPELTF